MNWNLTWHTPLGTSSSSNTGQLRLGMQVGKGGRGRVGRKDSMRNGIYREPACEQTLRISIIWVSKEEKKGDWR